MARGSTDIDAGRLTRLLDAGRGLLADLDVGLVLDRLLELGRELTGARYAALGILDEQRAELEQFLTTGVDEETHRVIGDLPHGRGILGVLIDEPEPLRLHDVGGHPKSYGFPAGHPPTRGLPAVGFTPKPCGFPAAPPPMRTFLGVPVIIRGEAWGNLYLTEKAGGEDFDEADEASAVVLADWAAIAIENARLYERVNARRTELERAVRGFEATATIARAVGGETDLDRVLELIVKRGRALIEARDVVILLREGDELRLAAGAGSLAVPEGVRVPVEDSPIAAVLRQAHAQRVDDPEGRIGVRLATLGVPDADAALIVPLVYRGAALGVLVAFDRLTGDVGFSRDDEQLLEAFAASAATAVATAKTVEADRLRKSIEAAEAERRRWARELHDETLQGLGGLKVLLSGASRVEDVAAMRGAIGDAIGHVTAEIENLRALITELRPAALDQLGLLPALTSLLQRTAGTTGLEVDSDLELPDDGARLAPELETTVYRLVQEALTNVVKHADAHRVRVRVHAAGGHVDVLVADDGRGLRAGRGEGTGFRLRGVRERE